METRIPPPRPVSLAGVVALVLAAALAVPAHAQTAVPTSVPTPGSPSQGGSQGTMGQAPPVPVLPMPESVVWQANEHQRGSYGYLVRPRSPGQIQEVWNETRPAAAIYATDLCRDCTYKVRLREWMVTVIELPRGEEIDAVDIGDAKGFQVSKRGPRRLALRPIGAGYDSNLVVYGKSGVVYPIYLRTEGFNSENAPDLLVRINGAVAMPGQRHLALVALGESGRPPVTAGPPADAVPAMSEAVRGLTETDPLTPAGDFVADAVFDPATLRGWGEYELWGSDDSLKPETVFRDDHFTYLRFGERWKDIELPTAYVVVDEIDELVNTRVQGQTYIIESTRPLITLKSGQSYLCIKYTGETS